MFSIYLHDKWFGLELGLLCSTPLSTYFSDIVAVSFIGGGNRRIGRTPPTCALEYGLGIWCLTPLSAILQFNRWMIPKYSKKKHRPVANHGQALSNNVVPSTPRHKRVQTHNFSGDRN
jgi:hypothetical protein